MTDNKSFASHEGLISGAAILAFATIFGVWWSIANPAARLDKIEMTAFQLAKDVSITYVTLKAHEDLQSRLLADLTETKRRDTELREIALTKAQFDAWKSERDLYLVELIKRLDRMRDDIHEAVLRPEYGSAYQNIKDRIDQLYSLYRALETKESRNGK